MKPILKCKAKTAWRGRHVWDGNLRCIACGKSKREVGYWKSQPEERKDEEYE
jgi:hypothetical protein